MKRYRKSKITLFIMFVSSSTLLLGMKMLTTDETHQVSQRLPTAKAQVKYPNDNIEKSNSKKPLLTKKTSVPERPLKFKEYEDRKLLLGKYLQVVGGFTIPRVEIKKIYRRSLQLDLLPHHQKWLTGHAAGYVVELIEPDQMGTGNPSSWPELKLGRKQPALQNIRKINASGVFWLNEDEILTSGRKSYRSGFEPKWLAKVNLDTGKETQYTITTQSNNKNDNFHMLQALGGGFMRLTDKKWSKAHLDGTTFLLGKGGYDVLGSPLGPALGYWKIGSKHPKILLDYPHNQQPATRDPYYFYPERDPNTSHLAHIPMWRHPKGDVGFWQAGSVGGLAFINHPEVKGVLATHNFGRGLHDYRAQGDLGSTRYFLVKSPNVFYTKRGIGSRNDRGNHSKETGNSDYPEGTITHTGRVFDPEHLAAVYRGEKKPWDTPLTQFEWPSSGITWDVSTKNATAVGSVTWDNDRQLLWAAIGDRKQAKLVAYKIIAEDSRPVIPMKLSDQWRELHKQRAKQH